MRTASCRSNAIGRLVGLTRRTYTWVGMITLALLLLWPSAAAADGIAQSLATLDWSNLTFTSNGTLTFTIVQIDFLAESGASTSLGGFVGESKDSLSTPQWGITTAISQYLTGTGNSITQAQTDFGLLQASSQATAVSPEWSYNSGDSGTLTSRDFWLYGTGVGSITVTAPYFLSASCGITGPQSVSHYNTTEANASAGLLLGPGNQEADRDSVSCSGDSNALKSGVLSVSMNFNNPTFGPLVDIEVFDNTSATATSVPEPSSLLLLGIGLIGVGSSLKRKILS
jgi:hypothetical protein